MHTWANKSLIRPDCLSGVVGVNDTVSGVSDGLERLLVNMAAVVDSLRAQRMPSHINLAVGGRRKAGAYNCTNKKDKHKVLYIIYLHSWIMHYCMS